MDKLPKGISVFFPAYNDEATIERMVLDTIPVLATVTNDYEIIIIDDGSQDNTGKIADVLAGENEQVRIIHHYENRGYGGALKSGLKNSTKELIFYTDADGQYDVRELTKLLPWIEKYDFVYGNRKRRCDPLYRVIIGNIYDLLVRTLFNLRYKDATCDFRLFKKSILNRLELRANSGAICVELLKKVQSNGFKIKTVTINHYFRKYGKSEAFRPKHVINMCMELTKFWKELYFR